MKNSETIVTQWDEVCWGWRSESDDPGEKARIDSALTNILTRFQRPLTTLFAKRWHNFNADLSYQAVDAEAEEMYASFVVYVIERRKQIFRSADPAKGKLRTFLYTVAWRFANGYLSRQAKIPTATEIIDNWGGHGRTPEEEYEIDYVNTLINRSLKKLKAINLENYRLLKARYFADETPSISELAQKFCGLDAWEDVDKRKKIENSVSQKLSRTRRMFFELLQSEVRETIRNAEPEETEWQMQEEMEVIRRHIGAVSMDLSSNINM